MISRIIRLEGTVGSVCKKNGCWMELLPVRAPATPASDHDSDHEIDIDR